MDIRLHRVYGIITVAKQCSACVVGRRRENEVEEAKKGNTKGDRGGGRKEGRPVSHNSAG